MGKVPAQPDTRIWFNQFDITGYLNAGGQSLRREVLEWQTLNSLAVGRSGTAKVDHNGSLTAFLEVGTGSIEALLAAVRVSGAHHQLARAPGHNAEGSVAYEGPIIVTSDPIEVRNGALQMVNMQVEGAAPISRGLILANATVTGTGTRTGRNQGVTTAGTVYQAVVRVFGGTFTSITIQIHQSSDNGGGDAYALITGMTTTITSPGVVRLSTVLATEAWKRVAITGLTGTNAIIGVTGGIVGRLA